jgi:hypothetical protein
MLYFIDAFRWSVLGRGDLSPWLSAGITAAFAFGLLSFAVGLFRKGYKLIV